MKLRLPHDKLAGCVWLPRFIDKVRANRAGELPGDYRLPFCHPRGVDGHFLRHFGFAAKEIVAVIEDAADDATVETWFRAQAGVSDERIATWNDYAPNIGRPGHPGYEALRFLLRRIYNGPPPVPLDSSFAAIYFDETGSTQAPG